MDYQERYLTSIDGLRLYYRDYPATEQAGQHPTLICLPGLTRNSRDFEDLAPDLAREHRVLCPDFRGRGKSDYDPNWHNYHPGTYVADVTTLIRALGIEAVALIGTSLGGIVSMLLTHAHPELVRGVVLNDIGPEIAPEGMARIAAYAGKRPPAESWAQAVAVTRETYQDAWPDLSEQRWQALVRRNYREIDGKIRTDMDPKIGDALRLGAAEEFDTWTYFDALADIPTLLLRGEDSDILTDEIAEKMRARQPSINYVNVPHRGHVPFLDEPECVTAMDEWLQAIG